MSPVERIKSPRSPFRGMMPIMPTAIKASGAVDETSQRRVVQYCLRCGAVAIGHFGFASEFHKISNADRRRLIRMIVDEVSGCVPVFIGVTAPSNYMAVEYAKEAEGLGADLLMAAAPYVSVPDEKGLFTYYKTLSDAVSLPIIVQDTPLSAPILNAQLLLKLYEEVENIHYVKAEGNDFIPKTMALIEGSGGRMPVIGGFGGKHMIHMLRLGVTAFMTGTEALDLHAAVVRTYLAGDEETAARLYFERILPYFLFYDMYPDELLKRMLYIRGVIDCPRLIEPSGRAPMSEIEWREYEWILERVGLKRPWTEIPSGSSGGDREVYAEGRP